MSGYSREGTGQQTYQNLAYSKPLLPRDGNKLYNPNEYGKSYLNNYGKRSFIAPNNFIGIQVLRPANMEPNRQHNPSGLVWDTIKEGVPILTTPPIPKSYH
jgi:hypothetical protein